MEGGRLTWTNVNWNSACGPPWSTPLLIRWTASWPPAARKRELSSLLRLRKRSAAGRPWAVAAALVVMCCGAFGISSWRGANAVDSVVMLDVNPSLSMTVSSKERVLSVTPFNQDAEVILGDMDLTGTDLDVAVNALIGSMLQNGYLSDIQNAILVSVENQDAAKSAQLQQHLTDTINSVFQGGSLEGAVLSQTVTESADLNALAQQYGISDRQGTLSRR